MSRPAHPLPPALPRARRGPCRPCELLRRAGRVLSWLLSWLLLPRLLALGGALVLLSLMAPTSIPHLMPPRAKPAAPPPAASAPPAAAPAVAPAAAQAAAQAFQQATGAALAAPAAAAASAAASLGAAASAAQQTLQNAPAALQQAIAASVRQSVDQAVTAAVDQALARVLGASAAAPPAPGGPAPADAAAAAGAAKPAAPAPAGPVSTGPAPARPPATPGPATTGAGVAPKAPPAASTGPAGGASAPGPMVRFATRALGTAVVGRPWRPQRVVEAGSPPARLSFATPVPAWLQLSEDGVLSGTPDAPGRLDFTLRAEPLADPGRWVTHRFALRVVDPSPPRPPKPPPVQVVIREDLRLPDIDQARVRSYRLDIAAYEALTGDDSFDNDQGEFFNLVVPTRRWPTQQQLQAMLRPLVGVDFPTRGLFLAAVRAGHCGVLDQVLQTRPPPRAGTAPASGPDPCAPEPGPLGDDDETLLDELPATLTAVQAYQQLLPDAVRELVVSRARQLHPTPPARPTQWLSTDACQCAPSPPKSELYAWATPWGSTAQQQALAEGPPHTGPAPPPPWQRVLDFGLYTRVNWFGAVLGGNASTAELLLPDTLTAQRTQLARLTRQHSGSIDLVVYRRDWQALLKRPAADLAQYQASAAEQIVKQLNAPMALPDWHGLLLPFLREPVRAFDGVTLFFDQTPRPGDPDFGAYDSFFAGFVKTLTTAMQASGHPYRLNIVMPADEMGETGVYNFRRLMGFIAAAERPRPGPYGTSTAAADGLVAALGLQRASSSSKQVDEEPLTPLVGTTDIEVYYIPLLAAPTTASKKQLRERIDRSEQVKGPDRVYLLRSLAPMLLRPGPERLADEEQSPLRQFDDDLAYMKWNFGGTALWEASADLTDAADAALFAQVGNRYGASEPGAAAWCPWVCPYRAAWRLALQTLLGMGVVSVGLWLWNCALRRMKPGPQRWYQAYLWAGGLTVLLVFAALLTCDPSLAGIREHNMLLAVLVTAAMAFGIYWTFRSKNEPP